MMVRNIWIFSSVIDNFGDIGVAYRLARELAKDLEFNISLLIDDIETLHLLESSVHTLKPIQTIHNITIIHWHRSIFEQLTNRPDFIIETFGCFSEKTIPKKLLGTIPQLNIEYLSAEDWTLDFHLKPSISHQQTKFFYFLGFSKDSGGLLIEKNYLAQQTLFTTQHTQPTEFLQKYSIQYVAHKKIFLLFGYESDIWNEWIGVWDKLNINYELWIAGQKSFNSISQNNKNKKHIHLLPFVNQTDFDKLLWLADIIIIRGEDSFVRAQLAGKPFFWHIYPQADQTHLHKLQAFWRQVQPFYTSDIFYHQQHLSDELNKKHKLSKQERFNSWRQLIQKQEAWQRNTQQWTNFLFSQTTAYEKLTQFIKKQLK